MKAEDRTKFLLKAFGWQGGTIHQLAEETGCSVQDLLYADLSYDNGLSSSFTSGHFAVRTCSREFNLANNYPKNRGNLEFWFGVMAGVNLHEQGIDSPELT